MKKEILRHHPVHRRVRTGPDETGFLPVHDIEINTRMSMVFRTKTIFFTLR